MNEGKPSGKLRKAIASVITSALMVGALVYALSYRMKHERDVHDNLKLYCYGAPEGEVTSRLGRANRREDREGADGGTLLSPLSRGEYDLWWATGPGMAEGLRFRDGKSDGCLFGVPK